MDNGQNLNRHKKGGNIIYNIATFNNMNQRTLSVLLSRKREYLAGPENINKLFTKYWLRDVSSIAIYPGSPLQLVLADVSS